MNWTIKDQNPINQTELAIKAKTATLDDLKAIYKQWSYYPGSVIAEIPHSLAENPHTPVEMLIDLCVFYPQSVARNPALSTIFRENPDFPQQVAAHFKKERGQRIYQVQNSPERFTHYPDWFLEAICNYDC